MLTITQSSTTVFKPQATRHKLFTTFLEGQLLLSSNEALAFRSIEEHMSARQSPTDAFVNGRLPVRHECVALSIPGGYADEKRNLCSEDVSPGTDILDHVVNAIYRALYYLTDAHFVHALLNVKYTLGSSPVSSEQLE
ncbi:Uncharacterized protein HZ326_1380 [Fusarium oxysporum f. sp. albedinis]|nr:Uncharacterized protein HZ326_1380 [Fusarium oxysporum f. sp. albedinis]